MNEVKCFDRKNNYDLLRIISTCFVILIHVNALFYMDKLGKDYLETEYIVETIINYISRFSVPCFVMLSGMFVLNKNKNRNFREFYFHSFYKICLPYFFVELLWIIINFCKAIRDVEYLNTYFKELISLSFGNLWFVPMIMGLYMITPFIIKIKTSLTYKEYVFLAIGLMVWAIISNMVSSFSTPYCIGVCFSYLGYYVLGDVIELWNIKNRRNLMLLFMITIISSIIAILIRLKGYLYYAISPYSAFFSPAIAMLSISVFIIFKMISIQINISKYSNVTYYVYLIHMFVLAIIKRICSKIQPEIASILVMWIFTIIVSFIGAFIFQFFYSYYMKRKKIK